MKRRDSLIIVAKFLFICFLIISNLPVAKGATAYSARPGPYRVAVLRDDWKDPARDRVVPVKIYYPRDAAGPFPVIIFSHGLGGSREGYEYLGRHWAGYGYVSVHVQHPGSDTSVWKDKPHPLEAMRAAAKDLKAALDRPADVKFAVDRLEEINRAAGPLKGKLDLRQLGMAGHSFGAWTTLAIAGQGPNAPGIKGLQLADPRFKAALAMSAPVPRKQPRSAAADGKSASPLDRIYAGIKIPVFHMTGTLDDSPLGDTKAAERRVPFDHIKNAEQYLLIFNGGDHAVFSGRPRPRLRLNAHRDDAAFQDLIKIGSTAFWDAYLKHNAEAKRFLAERFEKVLGKQGVFEKKSPGSASQKTLETSGSSHENQ